jgi:hypothetical protein
MTVTRQQFLSLLEPKLRDIKSDADYPRRETIYTKFFGDIMQSKKATETYFERAGLGDFAAKAEGGLISYTDPIAGSELAFSHVRRSNGYKITQEMLDHDQYNEIVTLERDLQIAGDEDLEIAGHLVLNSGFGTTDSAAYGFEATGYDSLALFSTAHTRLDGGATQANRPNTDADLGVASLGDGIIQFQLWRDHRGRRIRSRPRYLVVHPNDMLTAKELLAPGGKPGTANNDINSLTGEGLTQDSVIVTPYLTDTDSWFLLGDLLAGSTVWHWDVQPRTAMEDDFDMEIIKRKRVHGMSLGHRDWVGTYGTSGAG